MTGSLSILNGKNLQVAGSITGSTIRAVTSIASSGSLTWDGDGSGSVLYIGGQFDGVGLVDCDLATQTLSWDATTKRFSCGTDSDTTYTAGQGLTLNGTSFRVNSTLSGVTLWGINSLRSSGSLVWEGSGSGDSLKIQKTLSVSGSIALEDGKTLSGGILRGFGLLTDCDTAGTSKLLWDTTTGRFSCGTDTDTNTTYTAGQGLSLSASNAFSVNTTITGSLAKFTTMSGATARFATLSGSLVKANVTLASSGGLVVEGTTSGSTAYFGSMFIAKPSAKARLDVQGTISGALITQNGAGNNFFAGNVGIGKTPTTKLEVVGTISGSIIRGTTLSGNVIRGGQFSQRQLSMEIFASGSTITTGSGKAFMTVPWSMSGYLLSRAWVSVGTGGYTGSTSVQVRNAEKGFRKLFSTPLTVDDRRYGSGQVVINASNRDVGAFDRLFFDIPSVATTAPKSPLVILLDFYKP